MIRFYNTLTRKKEEFVPLKNEIVTMYTCGPTVYDIAHIGNFRAYIFEDLLHRYLEYKGYKIKRVMNVTDVDDKTIAGSAKEGIPLQEYTQRYYEAFLEDLKKLRIKRPEYLPKATEHIAEMVNLVTILLKKKIAYREGDSIYFRINKFPEYGKLSHIDLSAVKPGARVEADEYTKEDVRDFVLWKQSKENEAVFWETEIGKGRPGWHIECSAMSMKYLGETLDIHTGGVDNIFPHHENEIAQSESATGKPFVRYWMHCAHLLVDSEKMSKSKGNFYTVRDLLDKGYNPTALRYLLLTTHYRDPLNFTEKALRQAENTVRHYNEFYKKLDLYKGSSHNRELSKKTENAREEFDACLADDLNVSAAMGTVFSLIREANIVINKSSFDPENLAGLKNFLEEIDSILVILDRKKQQLPEQLLALIKQREQARKEKNFKLADDIRNTLEKQGVLLEDTPTGTIWKR